MGQIGFSNYVYYPASFYETLSSYIDFGRGYLQRGGNEGDFSSFDDRCKRSSS